MPREGKWVAQENGLMSVRAEAGAVCAEGRVLPDSTLPVDCPSTFRSARRHALTHARKQARALRAHLWKTDGPDSKGFHFMVVSIYDTHKTTTKL